MEQQSEYGMIYNTITTTLPLTSIVLVGRTAEEMFELGMRANPGITMEVGKSL